MNGEMVVTVLGGGLCVVQITNRTTSADITLFMYHGSPEHLATRKWMAKHGFKRTSINNRPRHLPHIITYSTEGNAS